MNNYNLSFKTQKNLFFLFILLITYVSCYNGDKALIPYQAFVPKEFEEGFVLKFQPRVDIVFFVDHSVSMFKYQSSLAKNVDRFTEAMEKNEFLDYHIGVLKIPELINEGDISSGVMVGDPYFITRNTPKGLTKLKEYIMGGTLGSGDELFFSPLYLGFNHKSDLNRGFLRSDAFLAVIVVADTFDQSEDISSFNIYNELVSRKANDPSRVLGYGAIAYPEFFEDKCTRELDTDWSDNLFDFLYKFVNSQDSQIDGGIDFIPKSEIVHQEHYNMTNVFSLCDKDFGEKITNIGEDIRIRVSKRIFLPVRPIDGSIRIKNGGEFLKNDLWRHDFKSNSIVLSSKALLNQGQRGDHFIILMDEADPLTTIGKPGL